MEHQEEDEARRWSEKLSQPLPGQAESASIDDGIDQLDNL